MDTVEHPVTPPAARPHVVIVGAGFAGLNAARRLAKAAHDHPMRITVVDRRNYHTFQPLLYQVATAGLEPQSIGHSVRGIFHGQDVDFRLGTVTGVDLGRAPAPPRRRRQPRLRHPDPRRRRLHRRLRHRGGGRARLPAQVPARGDPAPQPHPPPVRAGRGRPHRARRGRAHLRGRRRRAHRGGAVGRDRRARRPGRALRPPPRRPQPHPHRPGRDARRAPRPVQRAQPALHATRAGGARRRGPARDRHRGGAPRPGRALRR